MNIYSSPLFWFQKKKCTRDVWRNVMFHLSHSSVFDLTIRRPPKVFSLWKVLSLWKGSVKFLQANVLLLVDLYCMFLVHFICILFWKSCLPLCCSQFYFLSLFLFSVSVDYACFSPVSRLPVYLSVWFFVFKFLPAPCLVKKNNDKWSLLKAGGGLSAFTSKAAKAVSNLLWTHA